MVNLLLNIVLWVVLGGFATFCTLYAFLASPWQDHMGRHVLSFMSGFAFAFAYAVISEYISEPWRSRIWLIVLIILAFLVWWRDAIFIKFQIRARKEHKRD